MVKNAENENEIDPQTSDDEDYPTLSKQNKRKPNKSLKFSVKTKTPLSKIIKENEGRKQKISYKNIEEITKKINPSNKKKTKPVKQITEPVDFRGEIKHHNNYPVPILNKKKMINRTKVPLWNWSHDPGP